MTEYDIGFFVGLMVGEGHFGGDGRQPHITLRMHTDHEGLFRWLERTFPGGDCTVPITTVGAATFSGWPAAPTCATPSCRSSTGTSTRASTRSRTRAIKR